MRTPIAELTDDQPSFFERGLEALLYVFVAICVTAALLCAVAYLNFYYDDTAYHIPNAVRMALAGDLAAPLDSPMDAHWFPAGAGLLIAALLVVYPSLHLTNVGGFLMFVLILFLLWKMSGFFTRDRIFRAAVLAIAISIPVMLAQTVAFYCDIHTAAIYLAVGYFALRSIENRTARDAYFALACAIALPGIKYSGILWFFLSLPVVAYCLFHARGNRKPDAFALTAIAGAAAFGGIWYVRNLVYRGNPTYPFIFNDLYAAAMTTIRPDFEWNPTHKLISPLANSWLHPWIPEHLWSYQQLPDMTNDAFGLVTTFALLLFALALTRFRTLSPTMKRGLLVIIWLAVAMTFATRIGRYTPRYILAVPLFAALAPAIWRAGMQKLGPRMRLVVPALTALAALHYVGLNVVGTTSATGLYQSWRALRTGDGIRIMDYARSGELRIGYIAGSNEFISRLYDVRLTNQLFALQFDKFRFHWPRKRISDEVAFVAHVRELRLDAIHVFDPENPTVELVRKHFPELVHETPPDAYPK